MNLKRFIGKCLSAWYIIRSKAQPSFSGAGEDLVIRYLVCGSLGIKKPTYLDIGTNHPYQGNNTYHFYIRGSRGVCIEPDTRFYELIRKNRKHDLVLQAGIGIEKASEAELYVFPHPYSGWNTFSREEAENRQKESGVKITAVQTIPLLTINDVIEKHFDNCPNILSIDAEGLDLDILKTLDFERFSPEVICVETITFSTKNEEVKVREIIDFVEGKGYFVFGDTHVNTIFCRKDAIKKI